MRALTEAERRIVSGAIRLLRAPDNDAEIFVCNAIKAAAGYITADYIPLLDVMEKATNPRPRKEIIWFGPTDDDANNHRRVRALRAMLLRDRSERVRRLKAIKAENAIAIRRFYA